MVVKRQHLNQFAPLILRPPAGEGDEMDVVVSENAAVSTAVEGLLAREEDSASGRAGSLQDTAHRLAEDLAQAISSR